MYNLIECIGLLYAVHIELTKVVLVIWQNKTIRACKMTSTYKGWY